MRLLLVAPVAGRQRVLETVGDDPRLDCQLEVKIFSTVDELLSIQTYLLRQIPEQPDILIKYLR